jgi:hypothetical protein
VSEHRSSRRFAVAAALLGLTLGVFAVEAAPRLLPGLMPAKVQAVQRIYDARNSWEDMMRPDRDLGFVLKPGLQIRFPSEGREVEIRTVDLGIDAIGYRDVGTRPPFDAIALGDSFTFCDDAPAETCWVRLLANATGYSIANLGINGYSNLAEARLLERVGARLAPKLVLVGFFPNDFKDNVHFYNWSQSGSDDYWDWMRSKRRSDTSEWLARNSVMYRLFDAARRYGQRTTFEHKQDGLDFVFRADAWWQGVVERRGVTPTYELTEQALRELASTAKDIDSRLVVLLFPFKEQVYWSVARQYYPQAAELGENGLDAPFVTVRSFLSREGIPFCDVTDDLRRAARGSEQLYLRAGAHWTDAGNRVAAGAVAECLAAKGMVAARSSGVG